MASTVRLLSNRVHVAVSVAIRGSQCRSRTLWPAFSEEWDREEVYFDDP